MGLKTTNFTSNRTVHASIEDITDLTPELECYLSDTLIQKTGNVSLYCNAVWDGISCWPPTPGGQIVEISCFEELNEIAYDRSQNATRLCLENGTWASRADYSRCQPLLIDEEYIQGLGIGVDATHIYYAGYGISLIASIIAFWIFLYFKELRCLRNIIHANLIGTFILCDLTWILAASIDTTPNTSSPGAKASCILVVILTYSMGTNFFWMFVEGLYLFVLVVRTFSTEGVKFYIYALIGWGIPAMIVIIWSPVKAHFSSNVTEEFLPLECPWKNKDNYDFIFIVPVISVLAGNLYFLGRIMWVLITKLRVRSTVEHQQYRKAAKALLVLVPLLGVTYVLVIVTPTHKTARLVFTYIQATLLSIQGFAVSLLYCFMNAEVRNTLNYHLERWRTLRNVGGRRSRTVSARSNCFGESMKTFTTDTRESCTNFST
ncbi:diuretic hormone receptor-like [Limulus polyphemus]|uniref:Diuretic hormone receptor-like n=1 Tax=Limulus polyphemus TaxID=6850 RepID=A0ABM1AZS9_LIMPO|nr:diuretic hormone receptor-like [Limulus polyphemus]